MKLVKTSAKFLVVSLLALSFFKPLAIPKLPPIQMLAEATETVHLS